MKKGRRQTNQCWILEWKKAAGSQLPFPDYQRRQSRR